MTKNITFKSLLGTCLLVLAGASHAKIKLRGYGSMGISSIVESSNDVEGQESPDRLGIISKRADFYRDLRFGLNLTSPLDTSGNLTFIGQIAGEHVNIFYGTAPRYIPGDPNVRITMSKLSYDVNDSLNVAIGVLPVPFWLISQETLVSYTYPWSRPPIEVYSSADVISMTGVALSHNFGIGPLWISSQLAAGNINYRETPWTEDMTVSVRDFQGGILEVAIEYEDILTRFVWGKILPADIYYDTTEEVELTPDGETIPANYELTASSEMEMKTIEFSSIGARGFYQSVFFMAEYVNRVLRSGDGTGLRGSALSNSNSYIKGYYATLGYEIGDIMPHFTYAAHRTVLDKDRYSTALSQSIPVPELEESAEYAGAQRAINAVNKSQQSMSLGLNYSFSSKTTLKFEASQTQVHDKYGGLGDLEPGSKFTLVSAGAAFVF